MYLTTIIYSSAHISSLQCLVCLLVNCTGAFISEPFFDRGVDRSPIK